MRLLFGALALAMGAADGVPVFRNAQQRQLDASPIGTPVRRVISKRQRVSNAFSTNPTRTNMLSGALIFSMGDILAQIIEHHRSGGSNAADDSLSTRRVANSAALGGVWNGLCSPQVYRFAEHLLPGTAIRSILLKTAMTVGFLSTGGNYCNLLARRLMDGQHVGIAMTAINADMSEVIANDLRVWPVWDALQFAVVPPPYRPVLTAAVCFLWSTYISMVAMR